MHKLLILIHLFVISETYAASKLVYMVETASGDKHIALKEGSKPPLTLTKVGKWNLYPDIDSSGRFVAYVEVDPLTFDSRLLVRDLKKNTIQQWAKGKGPFLHPNFSGDGRWLTYSAPLHGRYQIHLIPFKKTRLGPVHFASKSEVHFNPAVRVLKTKENAYFPQLSSDGSFLVFQRTLSDTKKEIVYYDIIKDKPITLVRGIAMAPSISFDDQWIVYTKNVNDMWNLYRFDWRNKKEEQLSDNSYRDFAPCFRSDGSVLFASDRNGSFELFEMSAEAIALQTYGVKTLLTGKDSYYAPSVSGETQFNQSLGAPMLAPPRSSFGTARVGDRIYVIGGHQGKEHTYPKESFLDKVEFYDLKTKKWNQGSSRKFACHGFGLATYGKYIYAFGGFAFSNKHKPGWKSLDVIERYDTENDQWDTVGTLPRRRSSNVVVQLDSIVYLIGGWDSTPKTDNDYEGVFHSEIDLFDLKTEKVSTAKTVLPDPLRRAFSSVVLGNEIVLVGGLGEGATHFELLDSVDAWNPKTNTWRSLAKLPFATFAPATGAIGKDLFVFGGMFKTGKFSYHYVNHVFGLKPMATSWQHQGRYVSETKGFSQVLNMDKNTLAIIGGHSYEGSDAPVDTFELFGK